MSSAVIIALGNNVSYRNNQDRRYVGFVGLSKIE